MGHLTCRGLAIVIWWGPDWLLVIPCIHHHCLSSCMEGGQGKHLRGVVIIVHPLCPCVIIGCQLLGKVDESIVIVHPPHPCIVVGHHKRWVRASGSAFEANGKGRGGKVSTRELSSSLSSSTGHLTCGGLTVIVWWGPCWLLVIGHPCWKMT